MKTIDGTVLETNGLTARLSAQIVAEANKFKSNITIVVGGEEADLKSIMNVMALVVPTDTDFQINIEGDDEDYALECFNKLLPELKLMK